MDISKCYGWELIADLKQCSPERFNRSSLDDFFSKLCQLIDMRKCEVHFWDDEGVPPEDRQSEPHTKGTSAVCFILTSTIVVHTLDLLGSVYVNIFSCKEFDPDVALRFTQEWFGAQEVTHHFIERT